MRIQIKGAKLLLLLASSAIIAACGGQASKHNEQEKPIITVTIEPQRYFVEAIAGDKFNVVSMVPKGANHETYDPIPQQLVSLGESKAYLRIGYIGFEQAWMDRLMKNTPHLQVFDTSKGVDLILNHEDTAHTHGDHEGHGHSHAVEPHIWSSATNALIIAQNTYKALCAIDKANEAYYLTRYDSLRKHIEHTDSIICKELTHSTGSKSFMIYHPALSYFARDYGLHQIAIEEGGKEPSPAHLKKLVDACKSDKVRIIFIQPEFDERNAETISKQTGAKIVSINPLNYDWDKEMLHVTNALINQ